MGVGARVGHVATIVPGEERAGGPRPTVSDIGGAAGVSLATVKVNAAIDKIGHVREVTTSTSSPVPS